MSSSSRTAVLMVAVVVVCVALFGILSSSPPPTSSSSSAAVAVAASSGKHTRLAQEALRNATRNRPLFRRCKYYLLDLGANIGVNTRKLFEPHLYDPKKADFIRFLRERGFNSKTIPEGELCAVMVEANPVHAVRLRSLESCYQRMGWPVAYLPAALSNVTGSIEFVSENAGAFSDWGAHIGGSLPRRDKHLTAVVHKVATVTLNDIFDAFGLRSKIVGAKLDVEGAEYRVFRDSIPRGLFCRSDAENMTAPGFQFSTVELHGGHTAVDDNMPFEEIKSLLLKKGRCKPGAQAELIIYDDESYLHDGQPFPVQCR